jgi:hypothetical protein
VTFAYRYDQNVVQPALDDIDNQFDAVDDQLADVDDQFDAVDDQLGTVNGELADVADEFDALDKEIDDVDNRIDGLDTLDELSCTTTQVVINDGGWRCADPVLARSFTGAFNLTLETTDNVGYDTSVAIGVDGNPIISHRDGTNGDLELYVCADAACTTGTNQELETTGEVGFFTSAAIGADGNPVISHRSLIFDQPFGDLELYVCDNPTCTTGTNRVLVTGDELNNVGHYTSVAIGADGNPVISHSDEFQADLELYVCDNPTCSTGTNRELVTADNVGYFTSVAIGRDGNPVISYQDLYNGDFEETGDLELYVCDNPTCTTGTNRELVTGADYVGWFTSVAIGVDGNPVISHYDNTNDDLELYVCDNSTCTTGTNRTLVTTGDVGYFTSVAIGADGNPVISHQDATNGDLEVVILVSTVTGIAFD